MTDIIFETTLIKGAKGSKGDNKSYQVPTGSIIAYDGNDTPEGWEETTAPEGMGGANGFNMPMVGESACISGTTTYLTT